MTSLLHLRRIALQKPPRIAEFRQAHRLQANIGRLES
jgi:hypothetical protein